MKRTTITLAAALTLALPLGLAAQGGMGHGQMGGSMGSGMPHQGLMGSAMMQGSMMQGGMGMMAALPGPGMLLRVKSTLGLTDDQVEKLEAMQAEAHENMRQEYEAAEEARTHAHQIMMGDAPDLDAFQAALTEASQHEVQAMVAMARMHNEAVALLNADQKATLDTLVQAMGEMMHEGMGEGMMHEDMDDMPMHGGGMQGGGMHGGAGHGG